MIQRGVDSPSHSCGSIRATFPGYVSHGAVPYTIYALCDAMNLPGAPCELHCTGLMPGLSPAAVRTPPQNLAYRLSHRWWPDRVRGRMLNRFVKSFRPGDIAFLPPLTPSWVYHALRDAGHPIATEMVNCHRAYAKPILEEAYARVGLSCGRPIDERAIAGDTGRLTWTDFVFSPAPMVTRSLLENGVPAEKIIEASYGWCPDRVLAPTDAPPRYAPDDDRPVFAFCGSQSIRKGLHLLLDAWRDAAVDAHLLLAGRIDPEIWEICPDAQGDPSIEALGMIRDIDQLYAAADVFVLPSLEEGSPLVTYEAAGAGCALCCTPMGIGRVGDGFPECTVVEPYEHDAWVEAIRRYATDESLRQRHANAARERAQELTWAHAGRHRAEALRDRLAGGTAATPDSSALLARAS